MISRSVGKKPKWQSTTACCWLEFCLLLRKITYVSISNIFWNSISYTTKNQTFACRQRFHNSGLIFNLATAWFVVKQCLITMFFLTSHLNFILVKWLIHVTVLVSCIPYTPCCAEQAFGRVVRSCWLLAQLPSLLWMPARTSLPWPLFECFVELPRPCRVRRHVHDSARCDRTWTDQCVATL